MAALPWSCRFGLDRSGLLDVCDAKQDTTDDADLVEYTDTQGAQNVHVHCACSVDAVE